MNPIHVTDDDIAQFNKLKLDRAYQYMILSLNDQNSGIVIEKTGEKGAKYDEIPDLLPKDDCRYVIVDFEFETDENPPRKTNKLVLFLYVPNNSPAKRRFPFASANDSLKKAFTGIQKEIQVKYQHKIKTY